MIEPVLLRLEIEAWVFGALFLGFIIGWIAHKNYLRKKGMIP